MVSSILSIASSALLLVSLSAALPHPELVPHDDVVKRALPKRWYHESDHQAYALFRRQNEPTDGSEYAQVGSATWSAGFPSGTPSVNTLPDEWVDALNQAVSDGRIPNIPPSTHSGGNPTYPSGYDPNGSVVCSGTYKCRNPLDLWDAPDSVFAVSFDDGPAPGSNRLYDFLEETQTPATHFMIGINILNNPQLFLRAFEGLGNDIAVHTWTHRYMTTLTNLEVVAELGWTMEIIHNSTGGRLPRYWRPPYGDGDNRVRAIAAELFGLETVYWNQDTEDWSIGTSGGATVASVNTSLTGWITGPKSPGLMILEHELFNQTSQAFINAYPLIVSNGWTIQSVADINGTTAYLNSADSTSPVEPVDGILYEDLLSASSLWSSSSSSAGSATGSSALSGQSPAAQVSENGAVHLSWSSIIIGIAIALGIFA